MEKSTCKDILYESILGIIKDHSYSWTGIDKSNLNEQGKEAIIHIVETLGPKMVLAMQEEIKKQSQYMMMDDLKGTSYGMTELAERIEQIEENTAQSAAAMSDLRKVSDELAEREKKYD